MFDFIDLIKKRNAVDNAEPCSAEKHVQEVNKNMHYTELEGGGGGYLACRIKKEVSWQS